MCSVRKDEPQVLRTMRSLKLRLVSMEYDGNEQ